MVGQRYTGQGVYWGKETLSSANSKMKRNVQTASMLLRSSHVCEGGKYLRHVGRKHLFPGSVFGGILKPTLTLRIPKST